MTLCSKHSQTATQGQTMNFRIFHRSLPVLVLITANTVGFSASGAEQVREAADSIIITSQALETAILAQRTVTDPTTTLRDAVAIIVSPRIDLPSASRVALGPMWRSASQSQQQRFSQVFLRMLIATYTQALGHIEELSVELLEARPEARPNRVLVKTKADFGRGTLVLSYRMRRVAEDWKIYDVLIDGISLLSTYRPGFQAQIRKSGFDSLLESLEARYGV